jgi:hypothetical protein
VIWRTARHVPFLYFGISGLERSMMGNRFEMATIGAVAPHRADA